MSEFFQVIVMMAAPATILLALRQINVRSNRGLDTDHRPAQ